MTPEQFLAAYEGREVKVNAKYGINDPLVGKDDKQKYIGKHGIVKGIESSGEKRFVAVSINGDDRRNAVFLPYELDLVKDEPLPLPG